MLSSEEVQIAAEVSATFDAELDNYYGHDSFIVEEDDEDDELQLAREEVGDKEWPSINKQLLERESALRCVHSFNFTNDVLITYTHLTAE
jgi:hypothetical protein